MIPGMRTLFLAVVVVALIAPATARALCVRPSQQPAVVNDGVKVPPGGGLLVATEADYSKPDEGEAAQPTWELRAGSKVAKPTIVTLAPGLVVYTLPAGMTAAELHDGKAVRARLSAMPDADAAKLAPIVVPVPKRIVTTTVPGRRGSSTTTVVTLKDGAPRDARALVVYDARTQRARSYGLVTAGATEVVVYTQGRCSALPNGTTAPSPKDRVVLRWVDAYGRLSPVTKAIVVARGRAG